MYAFSQAITIFDSAKPSCRYALIASTEAWIDTEKTLHEVVAKFASMEAVRMTIRDAPPIFEKERVSGPSHECFNILVCPGRSAVAVLLSIDSMDYCNIFFSLRIVHADSSVRVVAHWKNVPVLVVVQPRLLVAVCLILPREASVVSQ